MKIIAVFIFLIILFSFFRIEQNEELLNVSNDGICEFFVGGEVSNFPDYISVSKFNGGAFISCKINFGKLLLSQLENVKGVTIRLKKYSYEELLSKFKVRILKEEIIDEKKIIYGFSDFLNEGVFLDHKKVNIQIVVNGDSLIAGTPLILGSY